MPVYAIYHINLVKSKEQNLSNVYDKQPATPDAYRIEFEKVLSDATLPVHKTNKKKELIPLDCTVQRRRDGITILLLKNEKEFKHLEGKTPDTFTYHPGCYVIIDNRPGMALMAIERTSSFENKPDKVRDLIQDALNRALKDREMEVDIRARMHEGEFWDAVDEQCSFGDSIRRVSFDFPNPNKVKSIDATEQMNKRLILLQSLAQAVNAAKGTLHMEADKSDVIQLDKTQEDIAQMVHLCCTNGYSIAVRFKRYGLYRYGNNIKAFGHINEEYINEFLTGQTILGKTIESEFELTQWLDKIHESSENYIDEQ